MTIGARCWKVIQTNDVPPRPVGTIASICFTHANTFELHLLGLIFILSADTKKLPHGSFFVFIVFLVLMRQLSLLS